MKDYHWFIIIAVLIFGIGIFIGYSINKKPIIQAPEQVEAVAIAAPDSVEIFKEKIKALNEQQAESKKEINRARRRMAKDQLLILKLQEPEDRPTLTGISIDDVDLNNIDTTMGIGFWSSRVFTPEDLKDEFLSGIIYTKAVCVPDSIKPVLFADYQGHYEKYRLPAIQQEMARGHITWGALGFGFGVVAVLLLK